MTTLRRTRAAAAVLLIAATRAAAGAPARPVVAVVALNAGTETTDFLVPYGVLAESDAVDVHAVSTGPEPVALHPALTVELDETLGTFDAAFPRGADWVVVPAVMDRTYEPLVAWLRAQAAAGARFVAVCDGVWTLAAVPAPCARSAAFAWCPTPAAAALEHALASIARVHGAATADFVALQIEHPARVPR